MTVYFADLQHWKSNYVYDTQVVILFDLLPRVQGSNLNVCFFRQSNFFQSIYLNLRLSILGKKVYLIKFVCLKKTENKSKGKLYLDIGPKTGQFKNSNHLYQCGYDDLYEKVYSEQLVANDERTILISSQHLHSTPSQLFLTSHQTSSHS